MHRYVVQTPRVLGCTTLERVQQRDGLAISNWHDEIGARPDVLQESIGIADVTTAQ
jgi:hypothetical protein